MKYYLIDEGQLAAIRRAATRLHTEERMDGDQMRDMGHTLAGIADVCSQLEVPEELPTKPVARERPRCRYISQATGRRCVNDEGHESPHWT